MASTSAGSTGTTPSHNLEHLYAWLKKLDAAFSSRDAERVASFYGDEAVFITPGRAPFVGRAEITDLMKADFADDAFELRLSRSFVQALGPAGCAYARGEFQANYTDPSSEEPAIVSGSYIQIFAEDRDGAWRVIEDISSPGPSGVSKSQSDDQ